jgi:hypothetical protein
MLRADYADWGSLGVALLPVRIGVRRVQMPEQQLVDASLEANRLSC